MVSKVGPSRSNMVFLVRGGILYVVLRLPGESSHIYKEGQDDWPNLELVAVEVRGVWQPVAAVSELRFTRSMLDGVTNTRTLPAPMESVYRFRSWCPEAR